MDLVAYLRISSESQIDGYGLDIQDGEVRAWAARNGHRIVATFTNVESGALEHGDRVGLSNALAAVRDKVGDGLLIPKLDRLARGVTVQEAALAMVWRDGGRVFSAEAGEILPDDPDDPYRTAMREMAGVFAGLERRVIVKRLRDGRKAKAAAGRHATGQYPYGTRGEGHGKDRDAAVDPEEQRVIRMVLDLRDARTSYREIARTLDALGVPPRRARRWSGPAVRNIELRANGAA